MRGVHRGDSLATQDPCKMQDCTSITTGEGGSPPGSERERIARLGALADTTGVNP